MYQSYIITAKGECDIVKACIASELNGQFLTTNTASVFLKKRLRDIWREIFFFKSLILKKKLINGMSLVLS
jgi:hypothetical protein